MDSADSSRTSLSLHFLNKEGVGLRVCPSSRAKSNSLSSTFIPLIRVLGKLFFHSINSLYVAFYTYALGKTTVLSHFLEKGSL